MKIYTKTGDDGTTGIQGGKRIPKSHQRIVAYGSIDEVNAQIGVILSNKIDDDIKEILTKIQNDLFVAGADLSNPDLNDDKNRVTQEMIDYLEQKIDTLEQDLPPITNFILPGGSQVGALIHSARTITRRAETQIVMLTEVEEINNLCINYVNRLSDLLFVLGRTANKRQGFPDVVWKP